MTEVISVKFKNNGKTYFFDSNGIEAQKGQNVIVETSKGIEFAECAEGNHLVEDSSVIPPLRPVIRIATEADIRRAEENRQKEANAFAICQEKIEKHELDMKLVDVEYNFEGTKILFFFTSDGRVDFRELVKDLSSVFKTRIELRQIGIRDEARMLGGLGICGRPFCCSQFLDDFQPVSIKMAKTQGLSLNPTKISGTCGRLMCCLKYEQNAYEELVKNVPKVDAFVQTPMGKGSVLDVNVLRSTARVRLEDTVDPTIKTFDAADLQVLGGKAKRIEYLALKAEGKGDGPPPMNLEVHTEPEVIDESFEEEFESFAEEWSEEKPDIPKKEVTADGENKVKPRRHHRGRGHGKGPHAAQSQQGGQQPASHHKPQQNQAVKPVSKPRSEGKTGEAHRQPGGQQRASNYRRRDRSKRPHTPGQHPPKQHSEE